MSNGASVAPRSYRAWHRAAPNPPTVTSRSQFHSPRVVQGVVVEGQLVSNANIEVFAGIDVKVTDIILFERGSVRHEFGHFDRRFSGRDGVFITDLNQRRAANFFALLIGRYKDNTNTVRALISLRQPGLVMA